MPLGHGSTDTTTPATNIWSYGEDDVAGAGAGGLFSDFLNLCVTPIIAICKSMLNRLTAIEASATLVRTTNLACTTSSGVLVSYDAIDIANTLAGAFTITRSTGVLVCAKAGTWEFTFDGSFAANANGVRHAYIDKAPAASPTGFVSQSSQGGGVVINGTISGGVYGRWIFPLVVGDVIRVGVLQTSGVTINLTGAHLRIKQLA